MMRCIVIRPEPGASATVRAGEEHGIKVEPYPLSRIIPLPWEGPDPASVDALLVGSGNAIRHAGEGLQAYLDKPVFAVGEATADAARTKGLRVEMVGEGGLQGLLDGIESRPLRMLRLAGERNVPLDLPEDISVESRVLYKAEDLPMPDALVSVLREGAVVLLHSAGSAEHFRWECERNGLDLAHIRLAALGPRIAEAAGEGWGEVRSAAQPQDPMLLALAAEMCHEGEIGQRRG
jgi:uroporphyrinogen-III synthase